MGWDILLPLAARWLTSTGNILVQNSGHFSSFDGSLRLGPTPCPWIRVRKDLIARLAYNDDDDDDDDAHSMRSH